jgi:hypothetical protein
MFTMINVRDRPVRLTEALAVIYSGREVLLADGVTLRAQLVPCVAPGSRVPGLNANAIEAATNFDAPLPDEFWTGRA